MIKIAERNVIAVYLMRQITEEVEAIQYNVSVLEEINNFILGPENCEASLKDINDYVFDKMGLTNLL